MFFDESFEVTVRCRSRFGADGLFCETVTLTCLLAIRPMSAAFTPYGATQLKQIDYDTNTLHFLDENKQDGGNMLREAVWDKAISHIMRIR